MMKYLDYKLTERSGLNTMKIIKYDNSKIIKNRKC